MNAETHEPNFFLIWETVNGTVVRNHFVQLNRASAEVKASSFSL